MHAQFEKLCVLATSGQLSAAEAELLNDHLRQCPGCSLFLKDVHALSDTILPRILPIPRRDATVPDGMRDRFLAKAAAQGLRIDAGTPPTDLHHDDLYNDPQTVEDRPNPRSRQMAAWVWSPQYWGGVAALLCVGAICFVLGTSWHALRPAVRAATMPLQISSPTSAASRVAVNPSLQSSVRLLSADRDKLAQQTEALVHQLSLVTKEKNDAEAALQVQLARSAQDREALAQKTHALDDRAAVLQAAVDTLRQKQVTTEAALIVQEQQTKEYAGTLSTLQTQLETQQSIQQASGDEVHNLVAARNLHIIDVYDADGDGNRQKAFGRVFYVEGRSLVFYAYDLGRVHSQKKISFHVWGERADNKETTHSLGILRDDDADEQRWAMTFDDPKVLAQINSVYVTIEPSNVEVIAPTGKKVLYAFLGGKPNHP